MKPAILIAAALIAGCNTPGPGFRGVDPVRITVGQSTFDIRVQGSRAQAIRTNAEWAMRAASVAPRAASAIEQVSGCQVARMRGDQAMMEADLKCGDGAVPPAPTPRAYECEVERVSKGFADMTCRPLQRLMPI